MAAKITSDKFVSVNYHKIMASGLKEKVEQDVRNNKKKIVTKDHGQGVDGAKHRKQGNDKNTR